MNKVLVRCSVAVCLTIGAAGVVTEVFAGTASALTEAIVVSCDRDFSVTLTGYASGATVTVNVDGLESKTSFKPDFSESRLWVPSSRHVWSVDIYYGSRERHFAGARSTCAGTEAAQSRVSTACGGGLTVKASNYPAGTSTVKVYIDGVWTKYSFVTKYLQTFHWSASLDHIWAVDIKSNVPNYNHSYNSEYDIHWNGKQPKC